MADWNLVKELRQEWPAVKAAKWAVTIALVLGAGVGFGVASLWWTGTVSTLRERLAFSQDELQIAVANPNSSSSLLTKNVGRSLSSDEKKCLAKNFKDAHPDFPAIIVTTFPNDEARKYAAQFSELFLRMAILSGVIDGTPSAYGDFGVMVGLRDIGNPSDRAKKFISYLQDCKLINHDPIQFSPMFQGQLLPQVAELDFDLYIGPPE
jgi:hypothetical protein